jgi:N-acyl-phosphatidylethanolamine-hydrolysing phospholipase D
MSTRSPFGLFKRLSNNLILPKADGKTTGQQTFWQKPRFSTAVKMSSIGGAGISTALYAAVSNPAQLAAQPEEAKEKAHHLKNGRGFTNPWDSYRELTLFQYMKNTLL